MRRIQPLRVWENEIHEAHTASLCMGGSVRFNVSYGLPWVGGRTSPYRPGTLGSHTIPRYMAGYTSLGGPQPAPVQLRHRVTVTAGSACPTKVREAQNGNNHWVRGLGAPLGPKGVKVGRQCCAELLRLSPA